MERFKQTLFSPNVLRVKSTRIQSHHQTLHTIEQNKIVLNNIFTHRMLVDPINTLPYGITFSWQELQNHTFVD